MMFISLALILGLAWFAGWFTKAEDTTDAVSASGEAPDGLISLALNRIVMPIVILSATWFFLTHALHILRGEWGTANGVPMITEPLSIMTLLLIGIYISADALRERGFVITNAYLWIWPMLAALAAGLLVFALVIQFREMEVLFRRLPLHWQMIEGWFMGLVALVILALVVMWPGKRDLRLLLVPWGFATILSGIGPWMMANKTFVALPGLQSAQQAEEERRNREQPLYELKPPPQLWPATEAPPVQPAPVSPPATAWAGMPLVFELQQDSFQGQPPVQFDTTGFDSIRGPILLLPHQSIRRFNHMNNFMYVRDGKLVVQLASNREVIFEAEPLLAFARQRGQAIRNSEMGGRDPQPLPITEPFVITSIDGGIKAKLAVIQFKAFERDGQLRSETGSAWLFINAADLEGSSKLPDAPIDGAGEPIDALPGFTGPPF